MANLSVMQHTVSSEFLQAAILTLEENLSKIKKCFEELEEDDMWRRPNPASNSIGNIVLHLCGNVTQYILSSLGNQEDTRERDKEFSAQGGFDKKTLLARLDEAISRAISIIRHVRKEELEKIRTVQVYQRSGTAIIFHVAEHCSYHTGQIIFWTKLLKGKDLGFYAYLSSKKK